MDALTTPPSGETLPRMIERAARRLLESTDSGEVLEAKKIAEAALHFAKVTKAANETHADCLRIIVRAEMRMANEADAAQARGELAKNGQHGEAVQGLDSLGLDRRRLSEWRDVRDAGEQVVEEAIRGALSEGRAPTKADISNHVRGTFGTGDNEWFTPVQYIDLAREVLGQIDVDPASNPLAQKAVLAKSFFTKDDSGLTKDWKGNVWLNPPYAQPHIADFSDKMLAELDCGNVSQAIMLTHNYTDTKWFQKLAAAANAICFTSGRIRFESPDGELASPTQGQAFFYFGINVDQFYQAFSTIGFVMVPA